MKEPGVGTSGAATAWLEAADDLGLEVVAPYRVTDPASGDLIDCVALVEAFGSTAGAVLLDAGLATVSQRAAVSGLGYFVSLINVEAYATYVRPTFMGTLNDWGWFGGDGQPPAWYTGEPWS